MLPIQSSTQHQHDYMTIVRNNGDRRHTFPAPEQFWHLPFIDHILFPVTEKGFVLTNIPLAEQRAHGKYPTLQKQDQTSEHRAAKHRFNLSYIFKFAHSKKKVCIWTMNHVLGVAEAIHGSDCSKEIVCTSPMAICASFLLLLPDVSHFNQH